ncbi:helix-turn-helix transcriptional regulator [Mycobacteroides sp. LB1]|uniref:helix-turn-helix transcriptional regulator n=1 Tax=Mycobacteroides sp. LB1 TaxID=2750814 RepID=UPI00352E7D0E
MKSINDFSHSPSWWQNPNAAARVGTRQLTVWDGTRALTPRAFQSRESLTAVGAEYVFATERVVTPTDWFFLEPRHVIVVHRRGRLRTMELEFENGPSGRADPRVGDVWIIPANHRYSALAQGSTVEYCQLTLPSRFLEKVDLKPTIRQRDPLAHQIVEQIGAIAGRDDIFARLSIEWLTEILLQHLSSRLASGDGGTPFLYRDLDEIARAALIEYLDECPDSMIGLPQLAAYVDMTVREFTKAFAAAFHATPHQLLLDRRITRAKWLLMDSTDSITQISAQLGFFSPELFETAFVRRVGVTPSVYRQIRLSRACD